jgi:hypothetical protein
VVDIERHWVPTIPREGDIAIMDMTLTFQLDEYLSIVPTGGFGEWSGHG